MISRTSAEHHGLFSFSVRGEPLWACINSFFSLPPLKLMKYSEPCFLMNSGSISQPEQSLNTAKTSQVSMHAHNVMEAVCLRRAFASGTVVFCSYNTIKTSAQVRIAFGAAHIQGGLVRMIFFVLPSVNVSNSTGYSLCPGSSKLRAFIYEILIPEMFCHCCRESKTKAAGFIGPQSTISIWFLSVRVYQCKVRKKATETKGNFRLLFFFKVASCLRTIDLCLALYIRKKTQERI